MAEVAQELLTVSLEDELQQSYLDYAMSVIIGRALPDVRDGLKPVHRRVLHAMRVLAMTSTSRTRNRPAWSVTLSASTIRMATQPCTTQSYAWRSHFRCVTC